MSDSGDPEQDAAREREQREVLDKWRLTITVTTPEKTWEQTYESERDTAQDWRWVAGFATGFAAAHHVLPEQIQLTLEQWVDFDDGHAGGYPHWCKHDDVLT